MIMIMIMIMIMKKKSTLIESVQKEKSASVFFNSHTRGNKNPPIRKK